MISGLKKFLKLALGVGLFGEFFGMDQPIPVYFFGPSFGRIVSGIQKDGPKNGLPDIRQGASGFMNLFPRGIGANAEKRG